MSGLRFVRPAGDGEDDDIEGVAALGPEVQLSTIRSALVACGCTVDGGGDDPRHHPRTLLLLRNADVLPSGVEVGKRVACAMTVRTATEPMFLNWLGQFVEQVLVQTLFAHAPTARVVGLVGWGAYTTVARTGTREWRVATSASLLLRRSGQHHHISTRLPRNVVGAPGL